MHEIDCFHAVDGGGNCLPGPTRPFGMVRCGPDMINHNTSGYATGEDIRHFSHTHVAGTGGQGRYGNIGIVPLAYGADERLIGQAYENETAEPGYYAVDLNPRQGFGEMALPGAIRCELTSTHRCAVHRYHFHADHEAHLRFAIGACIGGRSIGGMGRWLNARELQVRSDCRGGWGHHLAYSVYAHIELDQDASNCNFASDAQAPHGNAEGQGANLMGRCSLGDAKQVVVRVGISFVSCAQAKRNLHHEVGDKSFDQIRSESAKVWRQQLQRFTVHGGSEADRTMWHTMWMRLYSMPSALGTDEVPWFPAAAPHFNDLYCLWDSVRCANSLFALVDPKFAGDLCACLMDIGQQTGWLPDAWIMGGSASIQGGCSSAVLFAEAVQKQLPGVDAAQAVQVLEQTQESDSPNPKTLGRYPGWRDHNFLDTSVKNCTSRSVEYAFHDHCTAILADVAGDTERAQALRQRSAGLWDLWSDEHKCFAPQTADRAWVPFNPWQPQVRDFWNDPHFYEGTGHDYALTSWHAMSELVQRHGGAEAFAAHLDAAIERCYVWKEINLHIPWLYHAVGMPHRSTRALRQIMDAKLQPGRAGMHDNEDMGAWSSWWLTGAMGLVPVPGSTMYLLGCPRFEKIVLQLCDGTLTITTQRPPQAEDVVIAARLNGAPLQRAWLQHHELRGDIQLDFTISDTPGDWGASELPPFGAC